MKGVESKRASNADAPPALAAAAVRLSAERGVRTDTSNPDDKNAGEGVDGRPGIGKPIVTADRERPSYADPVDDALDGTFPASDPPPWTLG